MIFGRPGSGKSTFAALLSRLIGLPLCHLDKYFYTKNWIQRDYSEFLQIQQNIVNTEEWIIDGNNSSSFELRWSRADLILYFNLPRIICYWRVLKRYFKQDMLFDDRAPGCRETVQLSLLRYMWSFEERVAKNVKHLREKYPQVVFKEIKGKHDLDEILQMLVPS